MRVNFPQLGTMISTESSVLEACGGLIPDPRDLRTLLVHQKAKGLLGVKGTTVGLNSTNLPLNVRGKKA